jgi:hypothetical protein
MYQLSVFLWLKLKSLLFQKEIRSLWEKFLCHDVLWSFFTVSPFFFNLNYFRYVSKMDLAEELNWMREPTGGCLAKAWKKVFVLVWTKYSHKYFIKKQFISSTKFFFRNAQNWLLYMSLPLLNPYGEIGSGYPTNVYDGNPLSLPILRQRWCCLVYDVYWLLDGCCM